MASCSGLIFSPGQKVRKYRRVVLAAAETAIDLGDHGPYCNLIEAVRTLLSSTLARRHKASKREKARELHGILKGVLKRIKEYARCNMSGVGRLVQREVSGQGGLAIFRRMDAAFLAAEKLQGELRMKSEASLAPPKGSYQRGRDQSRDQGRGYVRGKGTGGRKDMKNVTCFNCYQKGHMRSHCPAMGSNAPTQPDK